jgi:hypothetical protein
METNDYAIPVGRRRASLERPAKVVSAFLDPQWTAGK